MEYVLDLFGTMLNEVSENYLNTPIYIGGDFNGRMGELGSVTPESIEFSNLFDERLSHDSCVNTRG